MITPFSINPDPDLLYLTSTLRSTVQKVKFVVENRQGLTAILGDIGHGKSTILRYLFELYRRRKEEAEVALLHTPDYRSPFAFLKAVCAEFDIGPKKAQLEQRALLESYLVERYAEGRNVILFIDEAQKLPGAQLEQIRTFLNFETGKAKLIQIVLAAQLELRDKLNDPTKRALRSRIFAPSLLAPLTPVETTEMIGFRCEQAMISNPFPPETVQAIYRKTGGVPREVLKVCAIAYHLACEMGERQVPPEAIDDVREEAVLTNE